MTRIILPDSASKVVVENIHFSEANDLIRYVERNFPVYNDFELVTCRRNGILYNGGCCDIKLRRKDFADLDITFFHRTVGLIEALLFVGVKND